MTPPQDIIFARIIAWLKEHKLEMHTRRAATQTYVMPRRPNWARKWGLR